ncbi:MULTISPECIES: SAM-dependent methyltransferase [Methanocalculus]|uniref:SAM-dependent methyltransferase n=1 Tax=Methanocalculus TaxID=71151 RepID=UPI0020A0D065|nr:50S ribosomal protein L11 methyltransferase [Methanocalculus sp. AMF5]MCP1662614.1 protein-L-isoaspartate O-methyltransferase [Methanocalculus sp. AMF5]
MKQSGSVDQQYAYSPYSHIPQRGGDSQRYRSLVARITIALEKIASRSVAVSELYSHPYRDVVAKEITLAGIRSGEHVLNIGCGSVPFTAIHLARQAGVKVTALDCDPAAVRCARDCISRLHLQDSINIVLADAALDIPTGFDAAIVALQANPKEEILKKLRETGGDTSRYVFRSPSPSFKNRYDALPESVRFDAWIDQNMKTFNKSLLYMGSNRRQNT